MYGLVDITPFFTSDSRSKTVQQTWQCDGISVLISVPHFGYSSHGEPRPLPHILSNIYYYVVLSHHVTLSSEVPFSKKKTRTTLMEMAIPT
jgi:hypothetical protein